VPDLVWRPENPIGHTVEYSTNVIIAHDGTEQRIARTLQPNHSLEYTLLFNTDAAVRQFRTELWKNFNSVWKVPLWWDFDLTTAEVAATATTWPCDTTYSDIVSGDTIFIQAPGVSGTGQNSDGLPATVVSKKAQFATVNSVNPTNITTLEQAELTFPVGTRLYKVADCKIRESPQFNMLGVGPEAVRLSLDFTTRAELGGLGAASPATFQATADASALYVLDRRPLSPVDYTGTALMERVALGQDFRQFTGLAQGLFSARKSYLIQDRAELQYWENLLTLLVGRREPFYTPTFRADLEIYPGGQPSGPGWDVIQVTDESVNVDDGLDYLGQWFTSSSHKSLRIGSDQGEQYREVDSGTDVLDGSLDLTFTTGLTANTVIDEISFLERVRLGSDIIKFKHFSDYSIVDLMTEVIQQ